MSVEKKPAIEGWFTTGEQPTLLGRRCASCGTIVFPPTAHACPNPTCQQSEFETIPLSRIGKVWSYTDARYAPPPPYLVSEVYEPFAIAAVELDAERLVVLGQVADGYGVGDLRIGEKVELVVEPLGAEDGTERLVWRWRPFASGAE